MNIEDIIVTDRETLQEMINEAVGKALMDHSEKFREELKKDDLYSTQEIADKLNVSTSTIATYRKKGIIGYIQNGGNIGYTRQHYLDFIKENEINDT